MRNKENRNKENRKKEANIPVLSFFTGGGFLDMGFERAGFNIVWTNEVNANFAELYKHGMTSWRRAINSKAEEVEISNKESIEHIFTPHIIDEAFSGKKPEFFGIIGGPPCPDFSTGGKNHGGKGVNGRLSKIYIHRICKIIPSFFVFENVPGLYKTKIHREFLRKLERCLEAKGYCLDLRILSALELGLPQDRERLIMIGIRQEFARSCLGRDISTSARGWFPWPIKRKYSGVKSKFSWPSIEKRGVKPRKPSKIPLELTVYPLLSKKNDPSKISNGKDYFKAYSDKFQKIREGATQRKSFKRLHRYRFSPTVCYGHNEVHLHPWKNRRLSVREAMRIQGVPDSYVLPKDTPLSFKFSLVSNGVPVPLAFEVAKSLRRLILKGNLIT